MNSLPRGLLDFLADKLGSRAQPSTERVSGGCINLTYRIQVNGHSFFLKLGTRDAYEMYQAEAEGLAELSKAKAFKVPGVVGTGVDEDKSWLLLEWFDLKSNFDMEEAGHLLAMQHQVLKEKFGLYRDNHIGASPQKNDWEHDWVHFFGEHRLRFLSVIGERKGIFFPRIEELIERLPSFIGERKVEASLLHGDLWSGNISGLSGGGVSVYDPAVHYGDRECDLAMTELFGGFSASFYHAYQETYPLDDGYEFRKDLYQLYHIMNHALLFGGSYVGQSQRMIDALLRVHRY